MGATCCQAKNYVEFDTLAIMLNSSIVQHTGDYVEFNEVEEVSRKPKKCLTHEEFVATLANGDFENEVEECQPKKKVKDRKSTGFVTKDMVEAASARQPTCADAEEEDKENRPLTAIGKRIKNRKGTGAVSKQKLLEVLDDIDDDEEEAQKPNANESKIKQRKNTGFVTKEKLRKLLATLGEDEE
mmetsp:Transcript_159334/g.293676  ORF Transcript_159334/g.293676 Transcript_159334/m.293676 type:complete len:185 (-) Transcript_159334:143-697(-)